MQINERSRVLYNHHMCARTFHFFIVLSIGTDTWWNGTPVIKPVTKGCAIPLQKRACPRGIFYEKVQTKFKPILPENRLPTVWFCSSERHKQQSCFGAGATEISRLVPRKHNLHTVAVDVLKLWVASIDTITLIW